MVDQLLSLSAQTLADDHPDLNRNRLQAGLLLALSGRVGKLSQAEWLVKSQTNGETYQVTGQHGWACTCPGPGDKMEELYGLSTGRACKHVLAVVLCQSANYYPDPPTSVWDLLERLVRAQIAPKAPVKGKLESIELPGCPARLVRPYRADGREVLCLKVGRVMSGPLVEWKSIIDNRTGQKYGQWVLTMQARETYGAWVKEIEK